MTILTETRERFLAAITTAVPPERIAEIHFFAPIKQGGVESGVAVVAAWPEASVVAKAPAESAESAESAEPAEADRAPVEAVSETSEADSASAEIAAPDPDGGPERADELGIEPPPAVARDVRHVIYTARYRLTLKGIDRGKWETNVFAEADAPLITVDAVVRGVQRRSGDIDDATRMDGDDVRQFTAGKAARVSQITSPNRVAI